MGDKVWIYQLTTSSWEDCFVGHPIGIEPLNFFLRKKSQYHSICKINTIVNNYLPPTTLAARLGFWAMESKQMAGLCLRAYSPLVCSL